MARPIPPPDVAIVDPETGRVTQVWYDYLKGRDGFKFDVTTTAPTNGQVLVFNATTGLFVPGAN
jgi:hypothetical protein